MKKALLILLVLFIHAVIYAQDNMPAFGKVDVADLELKECVFDKGAAAMGLIKTEDIKVSIDENTHVLKTNTEYRVRIKIFTESGFSNASIVIPYSTSRSAKMTDIDAYIYNLDDQGKIVMQKVDKNQIFNEKSKSKKSSHSIRFTFPGLKKGSIIEYRYAREDKNSVDIHPWFFQEEIPSLFSQCIITMPVYMQISYHFAGTMPMEKDSSYIRNSNSQYLDYQQSFTMRAVPAFRPEPFMSSFKDNLQRIEFAVSSKNILTTSGAKFRWALYNDMLLGSPFFGLQFRQNVPSATLFVDSVRTLWHAEDKISTVYNYVKRNINWNGEQTFFSEDINACLKDKSGSSAEMNILLINLLRKTGIACYPLLISTRENGRLDQSFPSLGQFNGVDVLVINGDQVYVLDCVQKNLSYKTTPFNILNCDAMLVDRSNSKWVHIADSRVLMNTELSLNAKIDSTGVMSGAADVKFSGIAKAEIIGEEQKDEKEKANTRDLIDEDATDLKIDSSLVLHHDEGV